VKLQLKLINMPFGHLAMPSLALTQLKAVLDREFADEIRSEVLYLNMDVAHADGVPTLYDHALSNHGYMTGFGDWLFRQVAFPNAPDNADAYLERFYFDESEISRTVRHYVRTRRHTLADLLDALIERHALLEADIVGFTSLFAQTLPSAAMAARLKLANPGVVTLLGGPACEGAMGQEMARCLPAIDYVFCGPALKSLPTFIARRLQARADADDDNGAGTGPSAEATHPSPLPGGELPPGRGEGWVASIAGVCRNDESSSEVSPHGEPLEWGRVPVPDYSDFLSTHELHFPGGDIPPALPFQTSGGCWWGEKSLCCFCGLNGPDCSFDAMPPEMALQQFNHLAGYAPRARLLMAVDNIMPAHYPEDVFRRLEPAAGICVQYEVRPTLTSPQLEYLERAGVRLLQPGIEALATPSLRLMRKGLSAFDNIGFLKRCSEHDIILRWNLLLFSPGENEATYEKYLADIPRLAHLHPPEGAFPVNFVRYSQYAETPEAFGLDLHPQDFYALTYPVAAQSLGRLAAVFVDRNAEPAKQDAWLDAIHAAIQRWRTRYFNSDEQTQARLVLYEREESRPAIYDSRTGEEVRYGISDVTRDILRFLEKPRREDMIVEQFAPPHGTLDDMRGRGLLFEEGNRLMSLVIEPPAAERVV